LNNLLLSRDPVPIAKSIDFGLAKLSTSAAAPVRIVLLQVVSEYLFSLFQVP
jgi:hypothetical protein